MTNVIAISRPQGYENLAARLKNRTGTDFVCLTDKAALTRAKLAELKPDYVFLPHWSHIVPPDVFENFNCVIFHMTDVPFGRGGSPLQNLLSRGIYETKISALRCVKELDAGDVYLKKPFTLTGRAEEIYKRAAHLIEDMIVEIVRTKPQPQPQQGKPVVFQRRKPEESNLATLANMTAVYDHIRMLDADGYPRAFLTAENFTVEFENAEFKDGQVIARAVFRMKKE